MIRKILAVTLLVLVGVVAPAQAHTLTKADAELDAYTKIALRRGSSDIDVGRCWRNNRHRVSCRVTWKQDSGDIFSDYCLDNPSSCEDSCSGVVSVRYQYPGSYITRSRLIAKSCY